jgi:hypothetical protein
MGLASLPWYVAAALERVATALSVVCGLGLHNHPLRKKCFAFDGLPGQARRWRQTREVGKIAGNDGDEYPSDFEVRSMVRGL